MLCDLYSQEQWEDFPNLYYYILQGESGFPSVEVARWAGLVEAEGECTRLNVDGTDFDGAPMRISFAAMNDSYKLTFKDIAKLIEEQL